MFAAIILAGLVAGSTQNPGPHWVRRPTAADLFKVYPDKAARHALSGQAVIDCAITGEGRLDQCVVVSESPEGAGFGQAAVKLSRKFQVNREAAESGAHVQVPIHFNVSN